MVTATRYDVVVVGSGFGGSISALRLAQAGKSVAVLERGRRYPPGQFPRDVTQADSLLWRHASRPSAQGLYDVRFLSGIGTVTASGVGGGSLIYANIHVRPDAVVFQDPRWPRTWTRDALEPYFDKVARELRLSPVPESFHLPKREAFKRAANHMGRPTFDPPEAVSWTEASAPGRKPCQLCAECEFGCQHGAKNTMDLTYLARAEALGTTVLPRMQVSHVEPVAGGYRVHATDLATGEARVVEGARVVLSAGTLGTVEILLRSRDRARTLPRVSARLGHGYSGNGDFLGSLQNAREDLQPWVGPDVATVMKFFDAEPRFTLVTATFNQPVTEVLAGMGQPKLGPFQGIGAPLWTCLGPLLHQALAKGLLSKPLGPVANAAGACNLFAIGQDNANGRMGLKGDRLDVEWDFARENAALVARISEAMDELASQYGATYVPLVTWQLFRRPITVHSLGGAHLAESPEQGVVSTEGEVFHHPGLYVADGSVIPTAIGFHPVMTISAAAERIAESVAQSF
ncbi:GMC family oxidoreductase N-terminal domain-containing protein [Corallococcus sp. M34]|uniref:GMC family oxidoreductase N-terminal domain-containing protein n=1 Tax=Citreicoccus inhibens TaxID=2849499 RepID=UPI001C23D211|nr:GMC oxidoreductase [Citreicoccus inhibens]MBU8895156.1 GMC family oxidoreductase N-terminal domain-containing protein [Citreicoccus inhibens]